MTSVESSTASRKRRDPKHVKEDIIELLLKAGPLSPLQVSKRMEISLRRVQEYLREMKLDGRVFVPFTDAVGKGKRPTYFYKVKQ